jgi:hypothetical protein
MMLPETVTESAGNGVANNRGSKAGAPKGNQNRTLYGLTGGGWRPEWDDDRRLVAKFMRSLKDAVLTAGGVLDIPTVATIQTAGRAERVARLANRAVRTDTTLSNVEIVDLAERAAKASLQRDKCILLLGLDQRSNSDPWAVLDNAPNRMPALTEHAQTHALAPAGPEQPPEPGTRPGMQNGAHKANHQDWHESQDGLHETNSSPPEMESESDAR